MWEYRDDAEGRGVIPSGEDQVTSKWQLGSRQVLGMNRSQEKAQREQRGVLERGAACAKVQHRGAQPVWGTASRQVWRFNLQGFLPSVMPPTGIVPSLGQGTVTSGLCRDRAVGLSDCPRPLLVPR